MKRLKLKLLTLILSFSFIIITINKISTAYSYYDPQIEPDVHHHQNHNHGSEISGRSVRAVEEEGDEDDGAVWIVQLSDLHFSVHHPDRASDFISLVGPALSFIRPSLVLITGDLTDGKSKDHLTMKQDEDEWMEYKNVMDDVVRASGLNKSSFYDLRGNHDNFGVPLVGGSFDYFSKYSINGQLGRTEHVNSITIENKERKHLFVGIDSTMPFGLRGPTNLFGHPTDELLEKIDLELSQWNSQSRKPVTKITFGHFPLSFSAKSNSGKSLKDIFLKHSVSAYLCGHLHASFGKNLKRLHQLRHPSSSFDDLFQLNMHQIPSKSTIQFWEWEMGDWRRNRAMRVLAIDKGHVSYIDLELKSEAINTIVLPTFPLDSRFMLTASSLNKDLSSYNLLRALVFSATPITSVVARIYDSLPGTLHLVMEASMRKHDDNSSSGHLYTAPWNYKAFLGPSPDRFWLQIEATDYKGRSTLTGLRPFSVNNISSKQSWTWKEFYVMGCQWASLYYPIFWSFILVTLYILIVPKGLLVFSKKQYTYKNFTTNKGAISAVAWVLTELCRDSITWFGLLGYTFYLVLFPWFFGYVSTGGDVRGYMTYKGWVVKGFNDKQIEFIGSPDIMVVVLFHLLFVFLPAILLIGGLAAERGVYRVHFLSLSGKKEDDRGQKSSTRRSKRCFGVRVLRTILLLACLMVCWMHFKNCRALMKAYEMNPVLHFPVYSFVLPLLLAYTAYTTRRV